MVYIMYVCVERAHDGCVINELNVKWHQFFSHLIGLCEMHKK